MSASAGVRIGQVLDVAVFSQLKLVPRAAVASASVRLLLRDDEHRNALAQIRHRRRTFVAPTTPAPFELEWTSMKALTIFELHSAFVIAAAAR